MNEIKVFNYQENEVRTVVKDNEVWWVLKDVCKVLNIVNTHNVSARLDDDEKGVHQMYTLGGTQELTIINETGLYSVILRSDKPEAKEFKRWITHEVLPTIRKTGGYVNNDDIFIETYFAALDDISKASLKEILKNQRLMQQKIKEDAPKVLFADTVIKSSDNILMRDMAKLLCDNDINIGEKRLYKLLRDKGILMSDNTPYQSSINNGYFFIKETTFQTVMGQRISKTTLVTPAGQIWLISKVKEWLEGK